jgi:hypothetical protein
MLDTDGKKGPKAIMISFQDPRALTLPRCHDDTGQFLRMILWATIQLFGKLLHLLFVLVPIATFVSVTYKSSFDGWDIQAVLSIEYRLHKWGHRKGALSRQQASYRNAILMLTGTAMFPTSLSLFLVKSWTT